MPAGPIVCLSFASIRSRVGAAKRRRRSAEQADKVAPTLVREELKLPDGRYLLVYRPAEAQAPAPERKQPRKGSRRRRSTVDLAIARGVLIDSSVKLIEQSV